MSYNIRNANGMDRKTDYNRIASVILSKKPDVVALQELDSFTNRNQAFALKEIGERSGYFYAFSSAISFDGGKYGVGILSKVKPINIYKISLPGREEKRVLQIAEFKTFVIFNVHLSLVEEDRIASIKIINDEAAKIKKPVFLLGDLNATPESAAIKNLKNNWQLLSGEDFTFPADKPDRCIDYIFSNSSKIKVKNKEVVPDSISSDHRPILVDLKIM
jgi:endonuclease/exonuclease/phosphatase family metal-dependent hydrolase